MSSPIGFVNAEAFGMLGSPSKCPPCVVPYPSGCLCSVFDIPQIIVMGTEEERRLEELLLEESESDESDVSSEEDEGMGRVEGDIPQDEIEEEGEDGNAS